MPLGTEFNIAQVHRTLAQISERMERELGDEKWQYIEGCPRDWARLPRPKAPITVAIDGGYVHCREGADRKAGSFEVIAGVSSSEDGPARCFGFVNNYDKKPRRRLYTLLEEQGLQNNQQITLLSDGGDSVRNLQEFMSPEAEHILDWFHVTRNPPSIEWLASALSKNNKCVGLSEERIYFCRRALKF